MSFTKSLLACSFLVSMTFVSCSDFGGTIKTEIVSKSAAVKSSVAASIIQKNEALLGDLSKIDPTKMTPEQLKKVVELIKANRSNPTTASANQLSGIFFDTPPDTYYEYYKLTSGTPTLPSNVVSRVWIDGPADETMTMIKYYFLNGSTAQPLSTKFIKGNRQGGISGWQTYNDIPMPTITTPGFYFIWAMVGDSNTPDGFAGCTYFYVQQ